MDEDGFTHKGSISPKQYIEDYIKHYGRHRSTIVEILRKSWTASSSDHRAIIASRVLIEFGAAIEELFALTYAIYKQCNSVSEVFFESLFEYRHNELYSFVQDTDFSGWIENNFHLPPAGKMATRMSYSQGYYKKLILVAEACLNGKKADLFSRDFKSIHNKLKHPFLVLAPVEHLDTGDLLLRVILESKKDDMTARIQPINIGSDNLATFQSDILAIAQTVEFLLKLLLNRPWQTQL